MFLLVWTPWNDDDATFQNFIDRPPVLTYPMEHKTSLVYHVIEWQGCDYTIENDESLNERKGLKDIQRWNPSLC
jgi:hypothetical protein